MEYYQIDRYATAEDALRGMPDMDYKMVRAASAPDALGRYIKSLGDDPADYALKTTVIRGSRRMSAACPGETTAIWVAQRAVE